MVPVVDPGDLFQGTVVMVAPHMDDCVLGCGGTMARLPHREQFFVIYATDGMRSPAPVLPWRDKVSPQLGEARQAEARRALATLGVPSGNIRFLGLPDGRLRNNRKRLEKLLLEAIAGLHPAWVLVPFRYDRHGDHLAVNHALTGASRRGALTAALAEYFVYQSWRLLPAGDVRSYIAPQLLLQVCIEPVAGRKRAALECFTSQVTRYYPWQARPNLTPQLLDEVCRGPEVFLRHDPALPGPRIFHGPIGWIRLAHRLEPWLKRQKDCAVALWRRARPQ
jgi:LmbE family N-acetylglucosaminyl deacetylase